MKYLLVMLLLLVEISSAKVKPDKLKFKVGDCLALISVSEVYDGNTDRLYSKPTVSIFYDIMYKVIELDKKNKLYIVETVTPNYYKGAVWYFDFTWTDSNRVRLNCDGKYEIDNE